MVDLPAFQPDVLVVFPADLAVDHMGLAMIPGIFVVDAALGATVMPKWHDGLLGGCGHVRPMQLARRDLREQRGLLGRSGLARPVCSQPDPQL